MSDMAPLPKSVKHGTDRYALFRFAEDLTEEFHKARQRWAAVLAKADSHTAAFLRELETEALTYGQVLASLHIWSDGRYGMRRARVTELLDQTRAGATA
jgi:hypothetical protein